jgi:DNA polymerase-4
VIDAVLVGLVDRICRRLRKGRRVCRTVVLRLRFEDSSRATRSHTLAEPTAETGVILATARDLMAAAKPLIDRQGCTLVGISLSNLEEFEESQLALPGDRHRASSLDEALDTVRERFGSAAITRAVLLNREQAYVMPLLPDLE